MVARYLDSRLHARPAADSPFAAELDALADGVVSDLDGWDVTGALDRVWSHVRRLNRHVEETKPWELAKDPARRGELEQVLFDLVDGLRALAVALAPYLPETAPRILAALGQPPDLAWENVAYGRTVAVERLPAAPPLFPRVEAAPTAA
jgi:methionyl-tRNA synthetase